MINPVLSQYFISQRQLQDFTPGPLVGATLCEGTCRDPCAAIIPSLGPVAAKAISILLLS